MSKTLTKTYVHTGKATTISSSNGPVILYGICVNTTAAGTITVADGSGTFAILVASITPGKYLSHTKGIVCVGDLVVTTGAASNITILTSTA